MIPLEWITPVFPSTTSKPDEETVLPSFAELYKKTQTTLYPSSQEATTNSTSNSNPQDKSPKGSVDAPIQSLVDLINRHYAICTLSSCSGRISLFDPNHQPFEKEQLSDEPTPENPFTEASGKGRGRWVVVTHDRLHRPDDLVEALFQPTEPLENHPSSLSSTSTTTLPWILKFEPMLLHVAARSLMVGQALLQLALECGFRESGLVVTSRRVTVAIRSHSLSLAVPLQPPSHSNGQTIPNNLTPTPSYLRALVEECNSRMLSNWKHLQRLYLAMESKWFQLAFTPEKPLIANVEPLPSLQLWSAATVPVFTDSGASETTSVTSQSLSIYVLGGYGRGPEHRDHPKSNASSHRSSAMYRLCRSADGVWANQWAQVLLSADDNADDVPNVANATTLSTIPSCQGVAGATFWDHWILYWGGRAGPTEPLDPRQLWLLNTRTHSLWKVSATSECPPARWGHSLLSLSNSRWLLVGGSRVSMDDSSSSNLPLEDVYILHYLSEDRTFVWETLPSNSIRLEGGRMHAAASLLSSPRDDLWDILGITDGEADQVVQQNDTFDQWVWVQGGLDRTIQSNPLLSCKPNVGADNPKLQNQSDRILFRIGKTTNNGEGVLTTECSTLSMDQVCGSDPTQGWFGGSSCLLWSDRILLTTGGVGGSADSSPVYANMLSHQLGGDSATLRWSPVPLQLQVTPSNSSVTEIDFGSMVHHSCVKVSNSQLVLVGGGVSSFAFGELFSLSHLITLVSPLESFSRKVSPTNMTPNSNQSSTTSKNQDSKSSSSSSQQKQQPNRATTRVVYVEPANAKRVKTELERRNWLDKGYRMIPVPSPTDTNAKRIAIPLTETVRWPLPPSSSSDGWESCILEQGLEELPWSTARYAKK
eukprot:Nitzschia sp. Nitz4//scaffold109_size72162//48597//51221//NITZ4_005852-RA/size72162-processed-gene-0.17-mRNA-1//1//CDS//3329532781//944//frame0